MSRGSGKIEKIAKERGNERETLVAGACAT